MPHPVAATAQTDLGRFATPREILRQPVIWRDFAPKVAEIARQIGAATFLGLFVTAGVITSLLLDHFGWVGFNQHRAGLWRIIGAILMIGGVALVGLF